MNRRQTVVRLCLLHQVRNRQSCSRERNWLLDRWLKLAEYIRSMLCSCYKPIRFVLPKFCTLNAVLLVLEGALSGSWACTCKEVAKLQVDSGMPDTPQYQGQRPTYSNRSK